jgi:hypothetical protein
MLIAASVTTETPAGAQTGFSRDDGTEQLIGVQAAFHHELRFPLSNQFDGSGRGGMAVGRIDNPDVAQIDAALAGDLDDLRCRPDEDRRDQALGACLDGTTHRGLLARMRDGGENRLEATASIQQLFVLACTGGSSHGSG